MTADEIRSYKPTGICADAFVQFQMQREIAAQLAELNQQLREIVTEVKKKSVFGTIFG